MTRGSAYTSFDSWGLMNMGHSPLAASDTELPKKMCHWILTTGFGCEWVKRPTHVHGVGGDLF